MSTPGPKIAPPVQRPTWRSLLFIFGSLYGSSKQQRNIVQLCTSSAYARHPHGGEQVTASCFSHLLVDSHRHRALVTFEERGDTQRNSLLSSYICTTSFCHFRSVSLDTQAYTGAPGHPTTPQRPPQMPKDTPHLVRKRRRWAGLPLHFIASCQISTHR